jgi:uncharacterized protein (DUF952 family)
MIFYLVDEREWQPGEVVLATPGPEGFVHCCDEHQIEAVRTRYFAGATVVAVAIDPTQLNCETRYEFGAGGEQERFPHVYGPISRPAVSQTSVIR